MQRVDEASFKQVKDFDCAVAGAADQVVIGWVEGEAVDASAVDYIANVKKKINNALELLLRLLDYLDNAG